MRRFNFKLEKLLSYREFYERRAEIELAQAISEKDAIDHKLKIISKSKIEADKKIISNLKVEDLHSTQHYITRLNIEKENLLGEIIFAEEKIKEKQKKYLSAMADRKVISKLKENKISIWKKNYSKAEDDFIDDIVSFNYGKGKRKK